MKLHALSKCLIIMTLFFSQAYCESLSRVYNESDEQKIITKIIIEIDERGKVSIFDCVKTIDEDDTNLLKNMVHQIILSDNTDSHEKYGRIFSIAIMLKGIWQYMGNSNKNKPFIQKLSNHCLAICLLKELPEAHNEIKYSQRYKKVQKHLDFMKSENNEKMFDILLEWIKKYWR